jgi:hypothetical protein
MEVYGGPLMKAGMRRSDEGRMEKVSQRRLVEEDLPTKAR